MLGNSEVNIIKLDFFLESSDFDYPIAYRVTTDGSNTGLRTATCSKKIM